MSNWTHDEYPVTPWDSPGLPPRKLRERCKTHPWVGRGDKACAYRDDDPARCPVCHVTVAKGCHHTGPPPNGAQQTPEPPATAFKSSRLPRVGDKVIIERDETIRPSRGTWPQFRGRKATVIQINRDRVRPYLTEYGVAFGATRQRPDGSLAGENVTTWFKAYELRLIAAEARK